MIRSRYKYLEIVCVLLGVAGVYYWVFKYNSVDKDELAEARGITALTIYDLEGGREYSQETIDSSPRYVVSRVEVEKIFSNTQTNDHISKWIGSRLAVATSKEGREIRLAISFQGGFFKVYKNGSSHSYRLVGDSQQCCQAVIKTAVREVFIPSRKKKTNDSESEKAPQN